MQELRNFLLGLVLFAATCLRFHCHVFGNNTELSKILSAADTEPSKIPSANFSKVCDSSSVNCSELAHISSQNDFELVCIYFADGKKENIPLLLFSKIFSLPSNYLCSSTKVTDADGNSTSLNTFMVEYCRGDFILFLFSFHHIYKKISIENLQEFNCKIIYEKHRELFLSLKLSIDNFKLLSPILQNYTKEKRLRNWLIEIIKKERPDITYSHRSLQKWCSFCQYAIPIIFLSDLDFEMTGKPIPISLRTLFFETGLKKVGSGVNASCYSVKFQHFHQHFVFKFLKSRYIPVSDLTVYLRELLIFQIRGITSISKYNIPQSVIVISSSNLDPIGYLMEQAEYGDLHHFLPKNPDIIFTEYFVEQLFDLAIAIDNLHKHGVFHLDIKMDNIFVRKRKVKDSEDKPDYELVLADFGIAEMEDWNQKFDGNFKYKMSSFPPELFKTYRTNIKIGSYCDWYEYGKTLNSIAFYLTDPAKKEKYVRLFWPLINNTAIFHAGGRWGFVSIENFFCHILRNYEENRVAISLQYNDKKSIPFWFHKSTNPVIKPNCFLYVQEYKLCRFAYLFYNVNPTTPYVSIQSHSSEIFVNVELPIIYEFQQNYPNAISLPQTSNHKTYFFKGDFLLFQLGVFYYAEFYDNTDRNKVISIIATYNYLDIIKKINMKVKYVKRITTIE